MSHAVDLDDLVEGLRSGAISLGEFGEGVLARATRATAADVLAALPATERGQFEWWFVARFGDRIPPRDRPRWYVVSSSHIGPSPWDPEHPERVLEATCEAMHRAILSRREPL